MPPRSKRLSADAVPGESNLVIRNVTVLKKRTSLRMEPEMWDALGDVSVREGMTIHQVCNIVAQKKGGEASLTGALRVFLMSYFRAAATEDGHMRAGHGSGRLTVLEGLFGHSGDSGERQTRAAAAQSRTVTRIRDRATVAAVPTTETSPGAAPTAAPEGTPATPATTATTAESPAASPAATPAESPSGG